MQRMICQCTPGGCSSWPQPTIARPDTLLASGLTGWAAPIPDLSPDDQAIVAGVVALQRAKVRPQREPVFLRLAGKEQRMALGLAAMLRLADALDAEPAGSLHIQVDGDETTLLVGGERTEEAVRCADERADLWRDRIGTRFAPPIWTRSATRLPSRRMGKMLALRTISC